jgi:hypothetical protein
VPPRIVATVMVLQRMEGSERPGGGRSIRVRPALEVRGRGGLGLPGLRAHGAGGHARAAWPKRAAPSDLRGGAADGHGSGAVGGQTGARFHRALRRGGHARHGDDDPGGDPQVAEARRASRWSRWSRSCARSSNVGTITPMRASRCVTGMTPKRVRRWWTRWHAMATRCWRSSMGGKLDEPVQQAAALAYWRPCWGRTWSRATTASRLSDFLCNLRSAGGETFCEEKLKMSESLPRPQQERRSFHPSGVRLRVGN